MGTPGSSTPLQARPLRVRISPLQAAARLCTALAPQVALLHSGEVCAAYSCGRGQRSYLAAFPDDSSNALDPHQGATDPCGAGLAASPRWIGVLPYEARRALERPSWCTPDSRPPPFISAPRWLRYPAVACFDRATGVTQVVGRNLAAIERLRAALERPLAGALAAARVQLAPPPPRVAHEQRVRRAIALILAGDLYQVCLAHRIELKLQGSSFVMFRRMLRRAPAEFSAYLELGDGLRVLSTSPELLLRAAAGGAEAMAGAASFGRLWSEPIKGTAPRGEHAAEDRARRQALADDPKERAELAMIVDVVRNDLGSVARLGSVRLLRAPQLVTHATVHHRRALLTAVTAAGTSRQEVLLAMLPSGSVTGAPKVRAMEVIAALEAHRRGLYTGALGYVSHAGDTHLAMAIRTLVLRHQQGHY